VIPRDTLQQTRAAGQLQRDFFKEYLSSRMRDGADREIENASAVFEGQMLATLRQRLSPSALATPIVFTEKLSNRVLAIHVLHEEGTGTIAINARFKVDPEVLAHALVEEYAHAQQVLDGVDFAAQRQQFPDYASRPYEQEAKRLASELLGYAPEEYTVYLLREETSGVLYDRPVR
jgi:hypothetical protein